MIVLTVFYPKTAGTHFEMAYYTQSHIPMVLARCKEFGVGKAQVLGGVSSLEGGDAAYTAVVTIEFPSTEALGKALGTHGAEIMGDVPNFTDIQPTLQVSEVTL
jgi:uncharacterized protein (TIGR02118 family)